MKRLALLALVAYSTFAFADTKISDLPAGTALAGTEAMPAVQTGATVKTTPAAIDTYVKTAGATLGVAKGGTGAVTLTGVLKGSGTSAFSAAVSADIYGLWSGTCNSTTFLRGDGSCQAVTPGAAGSSSQVQYNSGGALAGSSNFTFNGSDTWTFSGANDSTLIGGAAATTTSAGRTMLLRAGPGGSTSGDGGTVALRGGIPVAGKGGSINIFPTAGVGTNQQGGDFLMTAGNSTGSGIPGSITVTAARGVTVTGGTLDLTAGAGGTTSGNGGATTVSGGLPVDGDGGAVSLVGRNGVGTNRSGGNVSITLGTNTGSGTPGAIVVTNGTATGSGVATFTATNKPGASNAPTLWLRIRVSGTDYWIPMFAN